MGLLLFTLTAFALNNVAPIPQACHVFHQKPPDKQGKVKIATCSGVLISPYVVASSAHCFGASGRGKVGARCGLQPNGVFSEVHTAIDIYVNPMVNQAGENVAGAETSNEITAKDFAFLRLAKRSSIPPLELVDSFASFRDKFTDENPVVKTDRILKKTIDCHYTGFGVRDNRIGPSLTAIDMSPRRGLKAHVAKGLLLVDVWGEVDELKGGDSGGPLYCRQSPSSNWKLIALLATANDLVQNTWTSAADENFLNIARRLIQLK